MVTEMNDTMRAVLGSMEPLRFTAKELQYVWLENARQQGWDGGKLEAKLPKNPDEEA